MSWIPLSEMVGFPLVERLNVVRAVLGFALVFFVPGFAWSLLLFRKVSIIERIALSVGLSIAVVTLGLFFVNRLAGIRITALNSVLFIIVVTILPLVAYYLNKLIRRNEMGED